MERILARLALARRQLAVLADEAVADGALRPAVQGADDVTPPRQQAVDDAVVAEGDDALRRPQPPFPPALIEGRAHTHRLDFCLVQREGRRQLDKHRQRVLVVVTRNRVGGDDFAGVYVDFDGQRAPIVCRHTLLLFGPLLDRLQSRGDDSRRHVFRRPRFDCLDCEARFAFYPPCLHQ